MKLKEKDRLIKFYDSLLENKEEAEWIENMLFKEKTVEFVIQDYITRQQGYFIDLHASEISEEYELSAKIFKTISIEEKSFIGLCKQTKWFTKEIHYDILNIKEQMNSTFHQKLELSASTINQIKTKKPKK